MVAGKRVHLPILKIACGEGLGLKRRELRTFGSNGGQLPHQEAALAGGKFTSTGGGITTAGWP